MFGDGPLTFQEFITRERLPLATIHDAVLEFLRDRKDAVLLGAQAVNAYVRKSRMTQDVDIASTQAPKLTAEVRRFLKERFHIAVGVQSIGDRNGFRISQGRKPEKRHLVDVRHVKALPHYKRVRKVQVAAPPELLANKLMCMVARRNKPQSFVDMADLYRVLLAFPELKTDEGPVAERLRAGGASNDVMAAWKDLVAQKIEPEDDDAKFGG
jgi:hypothetical protein